MQFSPVFFSVLCVCSLQYIITGTSKQIIETEFVTYHTLTEVKKHCPFERQGAV